MGNQNDGCGILLFLLFVLGVIGSWFYEAITTNFTFFSYMVGGGLAFVFLLWALATVRVFVTHPQAIVKLYTAVFWIPSYIFVNVNQWVFMGWLTRRILIQVDMITQGLMLWRKYLPLILSPLWFGWNLVWYGGIWQLSLVSTLTLSLIAIPTFLYIYFDRYEKMPRQGATWFPFIYTENMLQLDKNLNETYMALLSELELMNLKLHDDESQDKTDESEEPDGELDIDGQSNDDTDAHDESHNKFHKFLQRRVF